MRTSAPQPVPDGLPLLSRGRHRRPRNGACMMELVSLLAGERWSDAPACTHPLLARLARLVNDATSDQERHRLTPLVVPLVGLRPGQPEDADRWDAEIALLVASRTLPEVAEWEQGPLAAAVLTCDRALGDRTAAPDDGALLRPSSRRALAQAPAAAAWAADFTEGLHARPSRVPSGTVVDVAVGAVLATAEDPDTTLRTLLTAAVELCRTLAAPAPAPAPATATAPQPGPATPTTSRTAGATS